MPGVAVYDVITLNSSAFPNPFKLGSLGLYQTVIATPAGTSFVSHSSYVIKVTQPCDVEYVYSDLTFTLEGSVTSWANPDDPSVSCMGPVPRLRATYNITLQRTDGVTLSANPLHPQQHRRGPHGGLQWHRVMRGGLPDDLELEHWRLPARCHLVWPAE